MDVGLGHSRTAESEAFAMASWWEAMLSCACCLSCLSCSSVVEKMRFGLDGDPARDSRSPINAPVSLPSRIQHPSSSLLLTTFEMRSTSSSFTLRTSSQPGFIRQLQPVSDAPMLLCSLFNGTQVAFQVIQRGSREPSPNTVVIVAF